MKLTTQVTGVIWFTFACTCSLIAVLVLDRGIVETLQLIEAPIAASSAIVSVLAIPIAAAYLWKAVRTQLAKPYSPTLLGTFIAALVLVFGWFGLPRLLEHVMDFHVYEHSYVVVIPYIGLIAVSWTALAVECEAYISRTSNQSTS